MRLIHRTIWFIAYAFTGPAREVLAHSLRQIGSINLTIEVHRSLLIAEMRFHFRNFTSFSIKGLA